MHSHQLQDDHCPECGNLFDCATNGSPGDTRGPQKDDVTICLYCGTKLIFGDNLKLRKLTKDDYIPEDIDQYLDHVIEKIRELKGLSA